MDFFSGTLQLKILVHNHPIVYCKKGVLKFTCQY